MFTTRKIALVSVINDLVTDNRVNKICLALAESGYEVVLIGRRLPGSLPLPGWPFKSIRMNLLFRQGPLFYFFFMLRLFFKLLFRKADLLYANDLDTLLPNFLVARLKKIPLIYDSHELFCEVPELLESPFKRRLWLSLEGWMVPRLRHCITVNESIARIFSEKYGVPFVAVKNISAMPPGFKPKTKPALDLPANKKIILLQGAGINIDRGAEELVTAMRWVDQALLLIIGSGDCWPLLRSQVTDLGLREKVRMIEKLPRAELMHYTCNADLGVSIDKNTNPNYYNSLPNKVFDYLHAGVPILASRLPEIEAIINTYKVGDFIESHEPRHIAEKLNGMLQSPQLPVYRANTETAGKELNWESEKEKLMGVIRAVGGAS